MKIVLCYKEFELGTFDLTEGVNNITVEKTSSYIVIDYLMVESYIEPVVTIKSFADKKVTVCGWVRTVRVSKSIAFLELNDGSSFKGLQVILEEL